jgi:hypothetical protein
MSSNSGRLCKAHNILPTTHDPGAQWISMDGVSIIKSARHPPQCHTDDKETTQPLTNTSHSCPTSALAPPPPVLTSTQQLALHSATHTAIQLAQPGAAQCGGQGGGGALGGGQGDCQVQATGGATVGGAAGVALCGGGGEDGE